MTEHKCAEQKNGSIHVIYNPRRGNWRVVQGWIRASNYFDQITFCPFCGSKLD